MNKRCIYIIFTIILMVFTNTNNLLSIDNANIEDADNIDIEDVDNINLEEKKEETDDIDKIFIWFDDSWNYTALTSKSRALISFLNVSWEDISFINGSEIMFTGNYVIIAFLVYNPNTSAEIKIAISESINWIVYTKSMSTRYTVVFFNNMILLLENEKLIKKEFGSAAGNIKIEGPYSLKWKKYFYNYKRSNTPTKANPSSLYILYPGNNCFQISALVGKNCLLQIEADDGGNEVEKIEIKSTQNNIWQSYKFHINPEERNLFTFYRKVENDDITSEKDWMIDYRLCSLSSKELQTRRNLKGAYQNSTSFYITPYAPTESESGSTVTYKENFVTTDRNVITTESRHQLHYSETLIEVETLKEDTTKLTTLSSSTKPNPVRNLIIYSKNETNFWLKWQPPFPSTGHLSEYVITYKNHKNEKLSFNATCELWTNFVCFTISRLEKNTFYNITVQAKNDDFEELGYPTTVTGFTQEEASLAPENVYLELASNKQVLINWSHPSVTNGPLINFTISIENKNKTLNYNIGVNPSKSHYTSNVSLSHGNIYKISVYGINQFDGQKATLEATVLSPITEISLIPFVEYCTTFCILLLPKSEVKYNIAIRMKKKNDTEELVLQESDNIFFKLLLIYKKTFSFSMKNQSFEVILLSRNRSYVLKYPQQYPNDYLTRIEIIFTTISIILVLVLGSLIIFFIKTKKFLKLFNARRNLGHPEEISLIQLTAVDGSKKIQNLAKYIKTILKDDKTIVEQFGILSKKQVNTASLESQDENKNEQNVSSLANKVNLSERHQLGLNGYINASFIEAFDKPKAYIAAQGPRFRTVQAFWRMIWQEGIETIVMASHFVENDKRKCAEYWPQHVGKIYECALIEIKLVSEKKFEQYTHRIFQISNESNYCRQVQHLQLNWSPDHLTPLYPDNLVPLVKQIHEVSKTNQAPILIHCSQGMKRTGILILCDLALHMASTKNGINFFSLLREIWKQKPNLVPSVNQYILAHLVVYECLMEQEYSTSQNFKKAWHWFRQLCAHDQFIYNNWLSQQRNLNYNEQLLKICVMKHPNAQTFRNFWINVINRRIRIILFLNKFDFQWPLTFQTSSNHIAITKIESDSVRSDYTETKLYIKCTKISTGETYENNIFLYKVMRWGSNKMIPLEFQDLINVIKEICKYNDEKYYLISCHDGITASGLFVTLWLMIQTWRQDERLELRNSLRLARRLNNKFLCKKEQQKFLFNFLHQINKDPSILNTLK